MTSRRISLIALALAALPVPVARADYAFTRIAAGADFSAQSGVPSINDAGQVAFRVTRTGGGQGIYLGSGGAPTEIAATGGQFSSFPLFSLPVVNDSGTVAFGAIRTAGGAGIYAGSGGPVTLVADNPFAYPPLGSPFTINAGGTVAFSNTAGISTAIGGTSTLAVPTGGAYTGFGVPVINGAGDLGFFASLDTTGERSGLFRLSGGTTTAIASFDATSPLVPYGGNALAINGSGTVAFAAGFRDGGYGIFTGIGGALTTIAGADRGFVDIGGPSINDAGQVAFWGRLDSGAQGIFLGPDPVAGRVIGTGDALDGSTVTSLAISQSGLNGSGQIAFRAGLADGRIGFYVATAQSVPEPPGLVLVGSGGLILLGSRLVLRARRPRPVRPDLATPRPPIPAPGRSGRRG